MQFNQAVCTTRRGDVQTQFRGQQGIPAKTCRGVAEIDLGRAGSPAAASLSHSQLCARSVRIAELSSLVQLRTPASTLAMHAHDGKPARTAFSSEALAVLREALNSNFREVRSTVDELTLSRPGVTTVIASPLRWEQP